MEVLLDANFIVSCVRRKIDFIEELQMLGFKITIPREVMQELKDIRLKVKREDRIAVDLALEMVSKSEGIKMVGIGSGKVDESLIKYAEKGVYIASLDSYIKRSSPNRVVIHGATNKLVIERD